MSEHVTGHVHVRELAKGPAFYVRLRLPDGTQRRRRLGRVWTKRTHPPAGYLTRAQAEARLAAILAGDDPMVNIAPSHVNFRQACDERLRYLEHDRQRKRSTLRDYRNAIDHDLIPAFGESTPVEEITTAQVEAFKDRLLGRGVAHRTAQKVLVILHGVMARAKRKGWIAENPCEGAEKVTVKRSDDFHVLSVEQVHAVAREASSDQLRHVAHTAAFTGLRLGELLALRWRHVDFGNRILHVQRNYVDGAEDTPKSHRRRSVPLSDQAMVALDAASRREHFTEPGDLVFGNEVGEHADGDQVRSGFYAALEDAGLGHLRAGEGQSCSTTCATHSARSARRRASTCRGSSGGWGTPTSRPRCATCTTCRHTTTPLGSPRRSVPNRDTNRDANRGHPCVTQRNSATPRALSRAK